MRFCAWKVRSAVLVFPYCVGQRLQPVQHYNFVRGRVDDRSRFQIPKGFQLGIYMPGLHVSSLRPRSIGPCASRDSHCVALLLCKNNEERPPVHLMCHCMSLPDPALYDMCPSAPKGRRRLRTESCPGVHYDSSHTSVVVSMVHLIVHNGVYSVI